MCEIVELTPGCMVKNWKIEEKVGEGGFGAVYKCVNEKNELYALKVEGKEEKVQLLKMEVYVLAELGKFGGRHFCRIEDRVCQFNDRFSKC
ncbi:hypothetical protein Y032_0070g442 [Ancylostoma ceylanicum]|nr:hypothetical protein Y032_0070g442 [Ancylostoma ceylanicum]